MSDIREEVKKFNMFVEWILHTKLTVNWLWRKIAVTLSEKVSCRDVSSCSCKNYKYGNYFFPQLFSP